MFKGIRSVVATTERWRNCIFRRHRSECDYSYQLLRKKWISEMRPGGEPVCCPLHAINGYYISAPTRAEFMLDIIGAGATATSEFDWYDIWNNSKEARRLQQELEDIHAEGRNRPPVEAAFKSEFATSWLHQTARLLQRDIMAHWRSPTYLMAKLVLNINGGLFIGFTFFMSKDTQQGTQNKLFVSNSDLSVSIVVHLENRLFSWQLSLGIMIT